MCVDCTTQEAETYGSMVFSKLAPIGIVYTKVFLGHLVLLDLFEASLLPVL